MVAKDVKIDGEGTLPINEFKLNTMCKDPSIVMIAKRGSGKSVVCRALLRHFHDIPVGLVIAPTDKLNCFFGDFFPQTYIHYTYKSTIIEKLLARQSSIIEKRKKKEEKGKKLDSRAFIVMDDCLAAKGTWMKDPPITELLYNGRHYEIMYILTMQYPLGITPNLRSNFDYIFLLADDFVSNLKRMHDHYAGMFPNFSSFREIFVQLTANYGCLVISNRGSRASFLDKIFWYKAPVDNDEINMGCSQFRKFHDDNYDKNYSLKKKTFDINEYCNRKKSDKSALKITKVAIDDKGKPVEKIRKTQ